MDSSINIPSSLNNTNVIEMQKMVFLYNAILEGWTVKLLDENRFEFQKDTNKIKNINLEDYLRKFVLFNLNIDNITKTKDL